ncbi:MAG: polysaccharide deacetylase family protein [Cyclobacteriaceae bacterium]|jgi:peptidoglycan-N-acetylglucosamine deacetylase|nr:polysaccharide deacetylase family protein [Cyclobacteriaceae bacterium]
MKKDIPDKLVVLTFDDAPASHYSVVAPLLKNYGFDATFFVCEFPPNYADSTKYMNWRQIQELGKMGFEVANHTKSHAAVGKLSKEQFIDQLEYIEQKCDSLNLNIPVTFAYPGYNLSPSSIDILEERNYSFARAGGSRAYDPLKDHPYLLPSWATNADNRTQILVALEEAKNGKIVILTLHGVPDLEHPWVDTPLELFKEYLQYLSDNQFKVISLRDLENYIDVEKAMQLIEPDFTKALKN